MDARELERLLNAKLNVAAFQDYAPNGIQIEGKAEINKIVTGVSASRRFIEEAIRLNADAILVHHGYFWKNEAPQIVGMKYQRIKRLIQNEIVLLAYHLPLDGDLDLGNNAELGKRLGILVDPKQQITDLVFTGFVDPVDPLIFGDRIEAALDRKPLFSGEIDRPKKIKKVAWCTGGGQDFIEEAILKQCDAFISGEVSERTIHIARENDLYFYAAGHHATERDGILALGNWLKTHYDLDVIFVDDENPA